MKEIFRFPAARKADPDVELWFMQRPGELGSMARRYFSLMRECGDDVTELLHDGCPVACVGDAAFAYVNVFKAHANVGFFLGAMLEDPEGILEGSGKRMRHVKVKPGSGEDNRPLNELIEAAYRDMKARLGQA